MIHMKFQNCNFESYKMSSVGGDHWLKFTIRVIAEDESWLLKNADRCPVNNDHLIVYRHIAKRKVDATRTTMKTPDMATGEWDIIGDEFFTWNQSSDSSEFHDIAKFVRNESDFLFDPLKWTFGKIV